MPRPKKRKEDDVDEPEPEHDVITVKRALSEERLSHAIVKCHSHFNIFCTAFAGYIIIADILTKSIFPSFLVESSYPQFGKNMIKIFTKGFSSLVKAIDHAMRYFTQEDHGVFHYVILNDIELTWNSTSEHNLVLQQDGANIIFSSLEDVLMFADAVTGCMLHTCLPNFVEFQLAISYLEKMKKEKNLTQIFPDNIWTDVKEKYVTPDPWGLQNRQSMEVRTRQFWINNFHIIQCMQTLYLFIASAKG